MNPANNQNLHKKIRILAISIGVIYLYFGALKFFPNLSPAEQIGISTVQKLSFDLLSAGSAIFLLALMEVLIGFFLITGKCLKCAVIVAIFHLIMTFSPILLFPELAFEQPFISPSLLGQYILKNIILISALFVVYPSGDRKVASNQITT